jgi:hypothetical protein
MVELEVVVSLVPQPQLQAMLTGQATALILVEQRLEQVSVAIMGELVEALAHKVQVALEALEPMLELVVLELRAGLIQVQVVAEAALVHQVITELVELVALVFSM